MKIVRLAKWVACYLGCFFTSVFLFVVGDLLIIANQDFAKVDWSYGGVGVLYYLLWPPYTVKPLALSAALFTLIVVWRRRSRLSHDAGAQSQEAR